MLVVGKIREGSSTQGHDTSAHSRSKVAFVLVVGKIRERS